MTTNACSIQLLLLQPDASAGTAVAEELHAWIQDNSQEPEDQPGKVSTWVWPWQGKLRSLPVIAGVVWEDNGDLENTLEEAAQTLSGTLGSSCPGIVALMNTPGSAEVGVLAFDASGDQLALFNLFLPAPTPLEPPTGMPEFTEEALALVMAQPPSVQMNQLLAQLKGEMLDAGLPPSAPGPKRGPRF